MRLPLPPPPIGVPQATPVDPEKAPPPGSLPGTYAIDRYTEREVCRVRLRREPAGRARPLRGAPRRGLPRRRPRSFDPAAWRYDGGRLTLTSRRGHEVTLISERDGQWRRDPEVGATLILRKVRRNHDPEMLPFSERSCSNRAPRGTAARPWKGFHGRDPTRLHDRRRPIHQRWRCRRGSTAAMNPPGSITAANTAQATHFPPSSSSIWTRMISSKLVLGREAERRGPAGVEARAASPRRSLMITGSGSRRMQLRRPCRRRRGAAPRSARRRSPTGPAW